MPGTHPASRRSPLHQWHAAHGARFTDLDGWQVAAAYTDPERETASASASVALADVTAFAKVGLFGRGVAGFCAEGFRDTAATRPGGVATFGPGQDLACRLTEDQLLMLGSGVRLDVASPCLTRDVTCAYAGFWLLGPHTPELLRRLTALDVTPAAFPAGSCAQTSLAGVHALLVHPPTISPSTMRICVAWDLGEYVWERLADAGRDRGLTPLGHDALRRFVSLHVS